MPSFFDMLASEIKLGEGVKFTPPPPPPQEQRQGQNTKVKTGLKSG